MTSLDDQIARCEREIAQARAYQDNQDHPHHHRAMANMGEVDWMVARMYLTEETQGQNEL